jgi:hypothetical protein
MDRASALPRLQSRPKHLPPSVRLQLRIHRSVQHSLKSCTQERVTQLQERVMKQQLQLLQASIRIPEENRNQRQQQAALAPESAAKPTRGAMRGAAASAGILKFFAPAHCNPDTGDCRSGVDVIIIED